MNVAAIIRSQIGNWTMARVGARDLLSSDTSLRFRISVEGKRGHFKVEITLNPSDTYTVKVYQLRKHGLDVRTLRSLESVYAGSLPELVVSFSRPEGLNFRNPWN